VTALLELNQIVAQFPNQQPIFKNTTWKWNSGRHWAFVGPVGAGKSTFLKVLEGAFRITSGERKITRPILRVSFQDSLGAFQASKYFYQQRFNFIEAQDSLTVKDFLADHPSIDTKDWQQVVELFELGDLLEKEVIALSTGQNRRLRIARALLRKPEILLLDDPFSGMDSRRRDFLSTYLERLAQQGIHLGIACRAEEIPNVCTHRALLHQGQIIDTCEVPPPHAASENGSISHPASTQGTSSHSESNEQIKLPPVTHQEKLMFAPQPLPKNLPSSSAGDPHTPILELENVRVQYGERSILEGVNWIIHRGERWALFGENGAGKSTLLSLIVGDHPQVYSNKVKLWGRSRGSGESIWEVKQRIGFFSSEFQMYFPREVLVWQALGTGLFDGVYSRRLENSERDRVDSLLQHFGIFHLRERPLVALSAGEQRIALLARAMIKQPALLILDEPFQGLDWRTIEFLKVQIESILDPEQTLIFVTHDPQELLPSIQRVFRLQSPTLSSY
jgi:molybdate transport system ATP-binding protein